MNIVEKKLDEIRPYEKNPRRNDDAVDAVAKSIKEFGFKVPLVVDDDGVIVCGHTRYKAAQLLGLESVPCLVASDLTTAQIRAFRIADNKTHELAGWDFQTLDEELAELRNMGVGMDGFGFVDAAEINPDDFFGEVDAQRESKKKTVKAICPDCGKEFEVEV